MNRHHFAVPYPDNITRPWFLQFKMIHVTIIEPLDVTRILYKVASCRPYKDRPLYSNQHCALDPWSLHVEKVPHHRFDCGNVSHHFLRKLTFSPPSVLSRLYVTLMTVRLLQRRLKVLLHSVWYSQQIFILKTPASAQYFATCRVNIWETGGQLSDKTDETDGVLQRAW